MTTQADVGLQLPEYLQRAVSSPVTKTGAYALLTSDQYIEIAREVYDHSKGVDCDNPKGCDVSLSLKGLSERSTPKRVLDRMLEGVSMVNHEILRVMTDETHKTAKAVRQVNEVANCRKLKVRIEQA